MDVLDWTLHPRGLLKFIGFLLVIYTTVNEQVRSASHLAAATYRGMMSAYGTNLGLELPWLPSHK